MDVRGLPTIFGKDCKMKNYLRIAIARIGCSSQIPSSETSLVYNSIGSNCVFKSFIGRLVDLQLVLLFHSSARWRNHVSNICTYGFTRGTFRMVYVWSWKLRNIVVMYEHPQTVSTLLIRALRVPFFQWIELVRYSPDLKPAGVLLVVQDFKALWTFLLLGSPCHELKNVNI